MKDAGKQNSLKGQRRSARTINGKRCGVQEGLHTMDGKTNSAPRDKTEYDVILFRARAQQWARAMHCTSYIHHTECNSAAAAATCRQRTRLYPRERRK